MNSENWQLPKFPVETDLFNSLDLIISSKVDAKEHWCMHVVGAPGSGKSAALRMIAADRGYYYVQVEKYAKSLRHVLTMILEAYARSYRGGVNRSTPKRADDVIQLLSPGQYFEGGNWKTGHSCLIVDEFQDAEGPVMQALQSICEQAECVLVLSGNRDTVFSGRNRKRIEARADISRVCVSLNVPSPTARDIELMTVAHGCEHLETTKMCINYAHHVGFDLRKIDQLLKAARQICGPKPNCIHPIHVRGAALMIMHDERSVQRMLASPKSDLKLEERKSA